MSERKLLTSFSRLKLSRLTCTLITETITDNAFSREARCWPFLALRSQSTQRTRKRPRLCFMALLTATVACEGGSNVLGPSLSVSCMRVASDMFRPRRRILQGHRGSVRSQGPISAGDDMEAETKPEDARLGRVQFGLIETL